MSVQIPIKSRPGVFITLDKGVADKIGHWGWRLRPDGHVQAHLPESGSSRTTGKKVYLNQAVIWTVTGEWPKFGQVIEYVNGDKLDGRMENISVYVPNIIKIEGTSKVQIEIKAHKGTFITLDKDVSDKIGSWGWCLDSKGYAMAHLPKSGKKGKMVQLAPAVIWAVTGKWPDKGQEVDHINHDILDNSYENLHLGSKSDNMRNMNKQEGASSEFYGVYWCGRDKRWIAQTGVRIGGKLYNIRASQTPDIEIAKLCADCMRDLIGGFLPRNYPDRIFLDKWREIGEKQRRQIFRSMAIHNVPIHDNTIFIAKKAAA
jgi:hypothetical protein